MATKEANITEAVAQVAVETTNALVNAMAVARADNNQKVQNVRPKPTWTHYEATDIQLELHRQICGSEAHKNGGKENVSKL